MLMIPLSKMIGLCGHTIERIGGFEVASGNLHVVYKCPICKSTEWVKHTPIEDPEEGKGIKIEYGASFSFLKEPI
jgi:hypothetical protein